MFGSTRKPKLEGVKHLQSYYDCKTIEYLYKIPEMGFAIPENNSLSLSPHAELN